MLLPYSNTVPTLEFHRSVALLLSSQSRIPFSGGQKIVKLHGLTSQPPNLKNKKHPQTRTTQAEFLLSENQPLTVLGSLMMLHHCLRLRNLGTGRIFVIMIGMNRSWILIDLDFSLRTEFVCENPFPVENGSRFCARWMTKSYFKLLSECGGWPVCGLRPHRGNEIQPFFKEEYDMVNPSPFDGAGVGLLGRGFFGVGSVHDP